MYDRTTQLPHSQRLARLGIAGLSFVGIADALYMLAYDEGLIDSLICSFFGQGCNIVGRSAHAKHFGVPNSAVGSLGYAAMAILAVWLGGKPSQHRPMQSFGLAGISLAAFAASIFLTWEQAAKVKAWCFWCLLSAALNLLILPLALFEGWRSARSLLPGFRIDRRL